MEYPVICLGLILMQSTTQFPACISVKTSSAFLWIITATGHMGPYVNVRCRVRVGWRSGLHGSCVIIHLWSSVKMRNTNTITHVYTSQCMSHIIYYDCSGVAYIFCRFLLVPFLSEDNRKSNFLGIHRDEWPDNVWAIWYIEKYAEFIHQNDLLTSLLYLKQEARDRSI